jgi:hypothetical protein
MNRLWRETGCVRFDRRHESLGDLGCALRRVVVSGMVLQEMVLAHMSLAGVRLFDSKADVFGPSSARSVQPAVGHTAVRTLLSLRHLTQNVLAALCVRPGQMVEVGSCTEQLLTCFHRLKLSSTWISRNYNDLCL